MSRKESKAGKIIDFISTIGLLKNTFRFQDKKNKRKSKPKDSVASHSWRLAVMAVTLAEELRLDLDIYRAAKMALVHDLGEYLYGDIDQRRIRKKEISATEKTEMELEGFITLKDKLSSEFGDHIFELWKEFEQTQTQEAKFIVALDKLETIQQIIENGYKTYNTPGMIPNYADVAVANFPQLIPVLTILKRELKKEFRKGKIPWKKEYSAIFLPFIAEPRMDKKHKREHLPFDVIAADINRAKS